MKNISKGLLLSTLLFVFCSAQADAFDDFFSNISANVTLTNNYMWRGVSQSNNDPAIQGGFDYNQGNFYLGTWASNVNFQDGGLAHSEIDGYFGYTTDFNGFGVDVGFLRYFYPNASSLNWNEVYGIASYDIFSAGIHYSDNAFNSKGYGIYYTVGVDYAFPETYVFKFLEGMNMFATLGHYTLSGKAAALFNPRAGSYTDVNVGINADFTENLALSVSGTYTNKKLRAPSGWDDNQVVVSLSYSS